MIVADTSGVFTALDRSQPGHEASRVVVEGEDVLILSPFVLAELDYLLSTRISVSASIKLLRDVEAGAYELAPFTSDDIGEATRVVEQHPRPRHRARRCLHRRARRATRDRPRAHTR